MTFMIHERTRSTRGFDTTDNEVLSLRERSTKDIIINEERSL